MRKQTFLRMMLITIVGVLVLNSSGCQFLSKLFGPNSTQLKPPPVPTLYMLALDETVSIPASQRDHWREALLSICRQLKANDRIMILPIIDNTLYAKPIYDETMPAPPADAGYEIKFQVHKAWKRIRQEAAAKIEEALNSNTRATSTDLLATFRCLPADRLPNTEL